jgi:hypothetical protein
LKGIKAACNGRRLHGCHASEEEEVQLRRGLGRDRRMLAQLLMRGKGSFPPKGHGLMGALIAIAIRLF